MQKVALAIGRFVDWLDRQGYASYDPYDVWGTRYGLTARRLYYERRLAGWGLSAPVILLEMLCPRLRGLFVSRARYPTADAQMALGFLNLHRLNSPGHDWLSRAKALAADLLRESIVGYRGHCWGYPFDWQSVFGLIPKGTPHITATPYCYELFTALFDLTGDPEYEKVARSIVAFVGEDLKDTPTSEDAAACSYTPHDQTKVVNANAYRAFVLFDATRRFGATELAAKAWRNLRFILQSQRADGAWLYAIDAPGASFIDHFHTCFVIKNLRKLNRILNEPVVFDAIRRGYDWYRLNLFDSADSPRTFALAPRTQIVHLETYNVAESITLGALLKDDIPEAFALANKLAVCLAPELQTSDGYWVTRTYVGGIKHKLPFLRWPQAQMFYAMTNLLSASATGK